MSITYGPDESYYFPDLSRPLFKGVVQKPAYGITVNIQPTKRMNKRHWRLYSHAQQKDMLTRIEAKFRLLNPSVELKQLHFEECPTLKNIHFHALYSMPCNYRWEMETYYNRICSSTDAKTKIPWRHLDIKVIKDGPEEWIKYIQKDI